MSTTHFHPIILYSEDAKAIHEALVSSGHKHLAGKIKKKAKRSKTDQKYINALQICDGGQFDVDDDPVISRGDRGAYVMIWQWINREEIRC